MGRWEDKNRQRAVDAIRQGLAAHPGGWWTEPRPLTADDRARIADGGVSPWNERVVWIIVAPFCVGFLVLLGRPTPSVSWAPRLAFAVVCIGAMVLFGLLNRSASRSPGVLGEQLVEALGPDAQAIPTIVAGWVGGHWDSRVKPYFLTFVANGADIGEDDGTYLFTVNATIHPVRSRPSELGWVTGDVTSGGIVALWIDGRKICVGRCVAG